MSEEQPKGKEAPWSAPLETPESLESPEYEPLQPLEPAVVDALTEGLNPAQTPDLSTYFEQLSQQPQEEGVSLLRPPLKITMEACPDGLMGFCVTCQFMPCNYVKQRVLRAMITELAYGVQDKP